MAGFGPVGSTPVGALPSTGSAGTNYNAGTTVTVSYEGQTPVATYSFAPTRISSQFVEVLHSGSPFIRVSGEFVEVLHSGTPFVRVGELFVEVLRSVTDASTGGAGFVSILW